MIRLISILLVGAIVSMYFFPFEFVFLPGVNTKMAMAGIGLVLLGIELARQKESIIRRDMLVLSFIAAIVSLICYFAVVYNNTNDYTYVTYIVSMWVWLGGAYTAIKCIKALHGYVTVKLVCNYLIGVCVAQCIIALFIDIYEPVKNLVDSIIVGFDFVDIDELNKGGRLYGIGASLDVAGTRFAVALLMIAYWVQKETKNQVWYLLAFMTIAVVGNMIGRTTTVGMLMGICYWVYNSVYNKNSTEDEIKKFWKTLMWVALGFVPFIIFCYTSIPEMYGNIRFAFEGFFSLVEKGTWDVGSNKILKNMIVFPETTKTWVIGDGYFENPYYREPYYTGPHTGGYYMETDIGYLRFIFYMGLTGLIAFCYFFYRVGQNCMDRFSQHKIMFLMILVLHFAIWCKVSTDIFLVFALFLCLTNEENDERLTMNV